MDEDEEIVGIFRRFEGFVAASIEEIFGVGDVGGVRDLKREDREGRMRWTAAAKADVHFLACHDAVEQSHETIFAKALNCQGADGKGDRPRIVGGLEGRHGKIIVDRQVEAAVADPAQVECLAFDGSLHHGCQLAQDAQLAPVIERGVVRHRGSDEREGIVAAVYRRTRALGEVQARLAAAELPVVGDVIMDKRGGLEVLDRRGAGAGLLGVAAHRCGGSFGPRNRCAAAPCR